MKQTRREFVRVLFAAGSGLVASRMLAVPASAKTGTDLLPAPARSLNFIVFGDWGREGQQDQMDVAREMGRVAARMEAQFIISVGDNFYDDGVASPTDEQWHTSFEQVYSHRSLQVPWYVALGNHDYHGDCDAQIAYSHGSSRWNMPSRYFMLSKPIDGAATADFFFLDTTPMVKAHHGDAKATAKAFQEDVPKQMAWFTEALEKSTAPWKIVIGHHPIYSGGEHGDTPELIETILPLLQKHKVQAYFNGHDHDLQHLMAGDINLIGSGAGSKVRQPHETGHTRFARGCPGFTTVSLRADKLLIGMIDSEGTTVYTTAIPREAAAAVPDRATA